MYSEIEDFKTGWYGLTLGLHEKEIDRLIKALGDLKKTKDHFHFRSNYKEKGGVGDIEFYWAEDFSKDNMEIDDTIPIEPSR